MNVPLTFWVTRYLTSDFAHVKHGAWLVKVALTVTLSHTSTLFFLSAEARASHLLEQIWQQMQLVSKHNSQNVKNRTGLSI